MLLDFNTPQFSQMRYMSVIPESETRATIKFNVFSEKSLEKEEYDKGLRNYIHDLNIKDYIIEAQEWGYYTDDGSLFCYPGKVTVSLKLE